MDKKGVIHKTIQFEKWLKFCRKIKNSTVRSTIHKNMRVSTVFLGIDTQFGTSKPPILFETRIIGGKRNGEKYLYVSKEDAIRGHKKVVSTIA